MIPRLASLWPGAACYWRNGSRRGLGRALLASFLLNLAVFSVLIWPELFPLGVRTVVCFSVALVWFWPRGGKLQAHDGRRDAPPAGPLPLFPTVLREYLRCNWSQAEEWLQRRLRSDPGDPAARLLLARIYRRRGDHDQAAEALRRLAESPHAPPWRWEMDQEMAALRREKPRPGTPQDGRQQAA